MLFPCFPLSRGQRRLAAAARRGQHRPARQGGGVQQAGRGARPAVHSARRACGGPQDGSAGGEDEGDRHDLLAEFEVERSAWADKEAQMTACFSSIEDLVDGELYFLCFLF